MSSDPPPFSSGNDGPPSFESATKGRHGHHSPPSFDEQPPITTTTTTQLSAPPPPTTTTTTTTTTSPPVPSQPTITTTTSTMPPSSTTLEPPPSFDANLFMPPPAHSPAPSSSRLSLGQSIQPSSASFELTASHNGLVPPSPYDPQYASYDQSELPSYSAPVIGGFQVNAQYTPTQGQYDTFFRSAPPSVPLLSQRLNSEYLLGQYFYKDPQDIIIQPPVPVPRHILRQQQLDEERRQREEANVVNLDYDAFFDSDDEDGPTTVTRGPTRAPMPQQQQQLNQDPVQIDPDNPDAISRWTKFENRETLPQSFSTTLYHDMIYSSPAYLCTAIPLLLIPLTIWTIICGILIQPALLFGLIPVGIFLFSTSITLQRTWSVPFTTWRNNSPMNFSLFPGSAVQHALPFDSILCPMFCCQKSVKSKQQHHSDHRKSQFKQQSPKDRTTSLTGLAKTIDRLDRAKPVLLFAVTCYQDYNTFHLVNRYHVENVPLKDVSKAHMTPYRSHLYYIDIDSYSNVSCPPEEVAALSLPPSEIPNYLVQQYQQRPLRGSYLEFHSTYALSPDDFAWLHETRDRLIQLHSNDVYRYVDVDVLYCLDGISPSTEDYHFYRDLEGLSVIPIDTSPNALNHFSKYNTDGANNPRGLSSFGSVGELLRDFDYELTFAGKSPINTFLPITLQSIDKLRFDADQQHRFKLQQEREQEFASLNSGNNLSNLANLNLFGQGKVPTNELLASLNLPSEVQLVQIEAIHAIRTQLLAQHQGYDVDTIEELPEFRRLVKEQLMTCIKPEESDDNASSHSSSSSLANQTRLRPPQRYLDQQQPKRNLANADLAHRDPQKETRYYEDIMETIEPDMYRTSCKLPLQTHIDGFHFSQLVFNTFFYAVALGSGFLPFYGLCWRGACCFSWVCCCFTPRKYAFYHKKMIKLKQTYILPDRNDYLTR